MFKNIKQKIILALKDLKENHHVVGVKAEFESEGSSYEEVFRLKDLASEVGLKLTIKIGGCEAITDMQEAKNIGSSTIVAPMIESPYAMKKYVKAINSVFSEEERKILKFLINIETITGYNNLNDIISSEEFSSLNGFVLGRGDMTGSIGLTRDDVNSNQIYNIALSMATKAKDFNKLFFVGGGVSIESIPFFKKLPHLSGFQTRKIVFDSSALINERAEKGILKAIGFEILWLKNKQEYSCLTKNDEARIKMLSKYNDLIEAAGGISA